ncbi:esterase [compost metagenome]
MARLIDFSSLPAFTPRASFSEFVARGVFRLLDQLPDHPSAIDTWLRPGADAAHTVETVSVPIGTDRMPGWLFTPHAPSGATVLMLHGALTHARAPYYFYAEALLARGHRVLMIELDGHGDNPRPFSPQGLAENVPAALDYLLAREDVDSDRIGVLGFSLGGACAIHAMPRYPGVKALVTVATPLRVGVGVPQQLAEVVSLVSAGGYQLISELPPKVMLSFLDDTFRVGANPHAAPELLHLVDPRTPVVVNEALQRLDPLTHIAKLPGTPYLAVHGEWDNVVPLAHAHALHGAAPGPRALEVAPLRNHFTIMGCNQAVGAAVDWLERYV